jgi:hypothetical protein
MSSQRRFPHCAGARPNRALWQLAQAANARPHAPWPGAGTTAPSGPLWSQDTLWKAVPIPGRDRQKALPHARGRAWLWWTQGLTQRELQEFDSCRPNRPVSL